MIVCSLQPNQIVAGEIRTVSLILHNQSKRDCISLSARVNFPYEVGFLTGKRQFKIDVLKANERQEIKFELMGETPGLHQISFRSFRYRDGFGNIQSLTDVELDVEVLTRRPSLQKVDEIESTSEILLQQMWQILLAEMPSRFSMEELKTLSINLGINHEEVGGTERTPFVRNLIDFCDRRGKLDELKKMVVKERPFLKNKLLP